MNFLIEEEHITETFATPSKLSVTYLRWEKLHKPTIFFFQDKYGTICVQEKQLLFHTQIDHWCECWGDNNHHHATRNVNHAETEHRKIQETTTNRNSARNAFVYSFAFVYVCFVVLVYLVWFGVFFYYLFSVLLFSSICFRVLSICLVIPGFFN